MRLDKFLGLTGACTRSEAKRAIRKGSVTVNGRTAATADMQVEPESDRICFAGAELVYRRWLYLMLNKPEGYVSATEDGRLPTVLELLPPEIRSRGLFPCGRLDRNTLGLMLITDNGELSHRLLAPKSHVSKVYRFGVRNPLTAEDVTRLEAGVTLEDGYETLPATVEPDGTGCGGLITLTEGKYHQIKRMMEAVDNKIVFLERIRFGPLALDPALKRGEWRFLTEDEIAALEAHGTKPSEKTKT